MPASEVMHKWRHGQLHSGSKTGKLVKNRAQAIAIMLSEKRAEAANGGKYPERAYGGPLMGSLGIAPNMDPPMPMMPPQAAGPPPNAMQSLPNSGMPTGVAPPSMPSQAYGMAGPTLPPQASPQAMAGQSGMPMPNAPTLPAQASSSAANALQNHFGGQGLAAGGIAGGVGGFDMAKQAHTNPSYMAKSEMRSVMHGPIMSAVPGRTDAHKAAVPSGSYVVPADVVSGRGQGNTAAGMNVLQKLFRMGPYGSAPGAVRPGRSMPKPGKPPSLTMPKMAAAGGVQDDHIGTPVPVNLAGGELVIPPQNLQDVVHPDLDQAHSIMDKWVLNERKKHIKTLSKLPGPVQD